MLLLKAKVSQSGNHGNGILYGGGCKENPGFMRAVMDPEQDSSGVDSHYEIFFVETDFGNHMKLTWGELTAMYDVVGVRDYGQWKADRLYLQSQPDLLQPDPDALAMERMMNGGRPFR